jgi:hypothetical protein
MGTAPIPTFSSRSIRDTLRIVVAFRSRNRGNLRILCLDSTLCEVHGLLAGEGYPSYSLTGLGTAVQLPEEASADAGQIQRNKLRFDDGA